MGPVIGEGEEGKGEWWRKGEGRGKKGGQGNYEGKEGRKRVG